MESGVTQGMFCPKCNALMNEGAVVFRCPNCDHVEIMSAADSKAKVARAERRISGVKQISFPTLAGRNSIDGQPIITRSTHKAAL